MIRAYLAVEFLVLFVGIPLAYAHGMIQVHLFALLWALAIVCFLSLWVDRSFDRWRFLNWRPLPGQLPRIAAQAAVLLSILTLLLWQYLPDTMFRLVREKPGLWLMIMCLYPILSVYPQTVIYRAFLFHRYRSLAPHPFLLVAASGLAFSFMHLIFQNWFAPILTLIGGVLFAWTYHHTRSVLVSAIEHALYGCFMFTIGLGRYFYHGAVKMQESVGG